MAIILTTIIIYVVIYGTIDASSMHKLCNDVTASWDNDASKAEEIRLFARPRINRRVTHERGSTYRRVKYRAIKRTEYYRLL